MALETDERLSDKQYVTVVLRLLVDEHGCLLRGEAVDAASGRQLRFSSWRGMSRVVRDLVPAWNTKPPSSP
ncbi:MAG: hypothetical protein ACR2M0_08080 [Chloroflexia bacterium]